MRKRREGIYNFIFEDVIFLIMFIERFVFGGITVRCRLSFKD